MQLLIEQAKSGKDTCKYMSQGKWRYLYSKYKPCEKIEKDLQDKHPHILDQKLIILLGLGLAYELKWILKHSQASIFILEKEVIFKDYFHTKLQLQLSRQELKRITFVDKKNSIKHLACPYFIYGSSCQLDPLFYAKKCQEINQAYLPKMQARMALLTHPTLAKDLQEAFENLGYGVHMLQEETQEDMLYHIAEQNYRMLMSINPHPKLLYCAKKLGLDYLYWVVDTPCYHLYEKQFHESYCHPFVYDLKICQRLQSQGCTQVEYLPVAGNPSRMKSLIQELGKNKKKISY